MNPLELIDDHTEAMRRYLSAKRQRRRWAHAERVWENCCRRVRSDLEGIGITVIHVKPQPKPKE